MKLDKPFLTAFLLTLGAIAARVLLFAGAAASLYFLAHLGQK